MDGIVMMERRPSLRSALSAERLVAHNLIMGVSTIVAGALGFAMQALLSHRLAPTDYGAAFSVLSVLMVILLPANALMLVMARETSRDHAGERSNRSASVMWAWHRYLMLAGFGIAAAGIASASWLGQFLHLPVAVIVPAALSVPFGLALPLLLGQLQGHQRFSNLSVLLVGQAALRLMAAVAFGAFFGAAGVLIGVAVGNVAIYLIAIAMVHDFRSARAAGPGESRRALRSLGVILPSSLALAVLFGTDVLVVKHFFNPGDAGRYAAVAALGRAIFWGASAVGLVLFPKAAVHESQRSSGSHLVVASLALCLFGGVAGLAILSFGSGFVISAFAGSAYASAGSYLPWYAVAMTFFGGASVLVANGQARGRGDFLAVLIPITLIEPIVIISFHQTLIQVVQVLTVSMAALFGGLVMLYLVTERVRTRVALVLEGATA
jgi:O-antigen/teichoic acid export membrane protein